MDEHRPQRIFVAGHRGMVGRAIAAHLASQGRTVIVRSRDELDLTDQQAVRAFLDRERPDGVIVAAARVGGIAANLASPAQFLHDNLMIAANLIGAAHLCGVARLLQIGSSAIYPRSGPQPMAEQALLTGALDATHEPYAIAKIAAIKLCESYRRQYGCDFRSIVPTNLYGPGDNFDPETAHVVPAMLRRFDAAVRDGLDQVTIWGTGTPRRELLHVDDMAAATLHVFDLPAERFHALTEPLCGHVNVGVGRDVSILELAQTIARVTGYAGRIATDPTKPDGIMRKLVDVGRLEAMGWRASIDLEEGLAATYRWFCENREGLRGI